MSNHTQGDWYTKREGFSTVYVFCRIGGGLVQEVAACGPTNEGQEQQEANARLIAAAPDLLEALKALLDADLYADGEGLFDIKRTDTKSGKRAANLARAAIAKAEAA